MHGSTSRFRLASSLVSVGATFLPQHAFVDRAAAATRRTRRAPAPAQSSLPRGRAAASRQMLLLVLAAAAADPAAAALGPVGCAARARGSVGCTVDDGCPWCTARVLTEETVVKRARVGSTGTQVVSASVEGEECYYRPWFSPCGGVQVGETRLEYPTAPFLKMVLLLAVGMGCLGLKLMLNGWFLWALDGYVVLGAPFIKWAQEAMYNVNQRYIPAAK